MVTTWVNDLMRFSAAGEGKPNPTRLIFYSATWELVKWDIEASPNCVLCCSSCSN
jgi:hypothetical protein